ncbi:MAG: hypothetical protein NZO58_01645 [Gemmataceae bacterium]|nr:hypothetical protein [Gemmataceae bacterium]
MWHWVLVRPEPPGQFTARVVGLPDVGITAPTREEAVERLAALLGELVEAGELIALELRPKSKVSAWRGPPHTTDPDELAYLEALHQARQEDLDQVLQELPQECSDTSSTPTI